MWDGKQIYNCFKRLSESTSLRRVIPSVTSASQKTLENVQRGKKVAHPQVVLPLHSYFLSLNL